MTRDVDDEKARAERAARLHAQIDDLIKAGAPASTEEDAPPAAPAKSPRDFIHERMADLAKEQKPR